MTMVMLAMLFMLEQRLKQRESYPLMNCADVVALLYHALSHRVVSEEEVLRQLKERHRRRDGQLSISIENELANREFIM